MNEAPVRRTRRDPGGARATARDLVALRFLAHVQPATTAHLQVLLGTSTQMIRRRLRVLRDLGLVQIHVPQMAGLNWYTLGPRAPAVLARTLGGDAHEYRVPRGLGRVQLDHHGGMVGLLAALTVATARSTRWTLDEALTEREIRQRLRSPREALVPDATIRLVDKAGRQVALALEVDTGSENPRWVADHKGLQFTHLREAGQPLMGCDAWTVCVVCTSDVRRRNRLALALWEAGVPEGLFFFAQAGEVTPDNILRSAWWTPRMSQDGATATLVAQSPLAGASTVTLNRNHGDHGLGATFSQDSNHLTDAARGPFTGVEAS